MRYLHTMVRVSDLEASLDFYCRKLGLVELRRMVSDAGRFTLVFLAAPGDEQRAMLELTWNHDPEAYTMGRAFGHLAYEVDDIYATCARLQAAGVIARRRLCGAEIVEETHGEHRGRFCLGPVAGGESEK